MCYCVSVCTSVCVRVCVCMHVLTDQVFHVLGAAGEEEGRQRASAEAGEGRAHHRGNPAQGEWYLSVFSTQHRNPQQQDITWSPGNSDH